MLETEKKLESAISTRSPFGWVSLAWLILSQGLIRVFSSDSAEAFASSLGGLLLWLLCVLDLLVLRKLVSMIFQMMSAPSERNWIHSLQTAFWGGAKLLCLGLFIIVLLKGHKIPMHGLILGIGTLGVIPVVGGFFWSQRTLRNA